LLFPVTRDIVAAVSALTLTITLIFVGGYFQLTEAFVTNCGCYCLIATLTTMTQSRHFQRHLLLFDPHLALVTGPGQPDVTRGPRDLGIHLGMDTYSYRNARHVATTTTTTAGASRGLMGGGRAAHFFKHCPSLSPPSVTPPPVCRSTCIIAPWTFHPYSHYSLSLFSAQVSR